MKTIKESLLLFLCMALMVTFSFVAFTLLRDTKDVIFISNVSPSHLPYFKWGVIFLQILVGIALMFIGRGGQIDRAFKVFYPLNIVFFGGYALLSYFDKTWVETPLVAILFYLWASVVSVVSLVLILGYANQQYTFKTAALQYPILSFLTIPAMMFSTYYMFLLTNEKETPNYAHISAMVAVLNFLIIFVFWMMNREYWGDKEFGSNVSLGYWAAIAGLVFGILFGKIFPDFIFKNETKANFTQLNDYYEAMQFFSEIKGGAVIIASILAIILGILLYFVGARFLWLVGIFLLALIAMTGVVVFKNTLFGKLDLENYGISALSFAYFSALSSIFLVVVKELAYFAIDLKQRFQAKVIADVIVQALAPAAGTSVAAISLSLFNAGNLNASLFLICFAVGIVICLISLFVIRRYHHRAEG